MQSAFLFSVAFALAQQIIFRFCCKGYDSSLALSSFLGNIQRTRSLIDIRTEKREKPERPGHKSLTSLDTIQEDSSGKGSAEKVPDEETNEVR